MNLKKKAQVIMLPKKHSSLSLYENKLSLAKGNHNGIPDKMIPQHLFIVDDSEIKEGDWFINILINKPFQCVEILDNLIHYRTELGSTVIHINDCKKVIATTDKNLKFEINNSGWKSSQENGWNEYKPEYKQLPSPSEQFIQKYVESYNKGNVITDVMVEYEGIEWLDNPLKYFPKVDSKNQVTITRCKDSWDREEVTTILKAYHHHTQLIRKFKLGNSLDLNDWIRENL